MRLGLPTLVLDGRFNIKVDHGVFFLLQQLHTVEQSIKRHSFALPSLLITLIQTYLHSLDLAS